MFTDRVAKKDCLSTRRRSAYLQPMQLLQKELWIPRSGVRRCWRDRVVVYLHYELQCWQVADIQLRNCCYDIWNKLRLDKQFMYVHNYLERHYINLYRVIRYYSAMILFINFDWEKLEKMANILTLKEEKSSLVFFHIRISNKFYF